jgi:hypothetical protein
LQKAGAARGRPGSDAIRNVYFADGSVVARFRPFDAGRRDERFADCFIGQHAGRHGLGTGHVGKLTLIQTQRLDTPVSTTPLPLGGKGARCAHCAHISNPRG